MTYEEIHNVIGCGDLFRVEAVRIVEHWDVTEEITPEATWVNRGKF